MLSLNVQMWILWSCLMVISLFFAFGLFASHNMRLWLIYTGTIAAILAGALSVSVGVKIYDLENKKFAIVLEKNLDARNQPDGDKILFTVHEGTKFQIKKFVDTWCFVSLPNGVSGWVRRDALGKI
jgi:SH3-like domain-containing protein